MLWDGGLTRQSMHLPLERKQICEALNLHNWSGIISLLEANRDLVNAVLPGKHSWSTLLHECIVQNAPKAFTLKVIEMGAFRTAENASGQRPIDLLKSKMQNDLVADLEPRNCYSFDLMQLSCVEQLFHGLIRAMIVSYKVERPLRLPQLSVLTELQERSLYFALPGMAGGFKFWLDQESKAVPILVSDSWSRIDGWEMRHRIEPLQVIRERNNDDG